MIGIIILAISVILLVIILMVLAWGVGTYNTFISARQDIQNQWSNIKTEYQRRADAFMNLVESVKSYKKHEKDTLTDVIKARSGQFGNSRNLEEKNMKGLEKLFNKMLLTFERYPELKANEQHNKLMEEVKTTENRINIARVSYNDIVNDYNSMVQMFPTSIVANMFNFKVEKFFENEPQTDKAPRMQL